MFCHFFPFSLGDCLYFLFSLFAIIKIVRFYFILFRTKEKKNHFISGIIRVGRTILYVYIVFMLLWGLNYSRQGIGKQLNMEPLPYSTEELCDLSQQIIPALNDCRNKLDSLPLHDSSLQNIYKIASNAYSITAEKYPFLRYNHPDVRKSLYTPWAPFIGYTGYYNPFTGEAQIRSDLPRIMLPFIVCHETAHQIGYADESEASFVAFIVAENSDNTYLRYSALIDLYRYMRMELFLRNTYPDGPVKLSKSVKNDLLYLHDFFKKEAYRQSETINISYDMYLRANGLKKGIESYNDVVAWAIQWYKHN